jgi:hypothetical protein
MQVSRMKAALFIKEGFLPWMDMNRKRPVDDHSARRCRVNMPSLKDKTVREVTQLDIESAKMLRLATKCFN